MHTSQPMIKPLKTYFTSLMTSLGKTENLHYNNNKTLVNWFDMYGLWMDT